jgi:hypothetical protein
MAQLGSSSSGFAVAFILWFKYVSFVELQQAITNSQNLTVSSLECMGSVSVHIRVPCEMHQALCCTNCFSLCVRFSKFIVPPDFSS